MTEKKQLEADVVRLSSKGQLTIPTEYREKIKLHLGDYLAIYDIGDRFILLEKAKPTPLEEISSALSKEAKRIGFSRKNLKGAIEEVRKEIYLKKYDRKT